MISIVAKISFFFFVCEYNLSSLFVLSFTGSHGPVDSWELLLGELMNLFSAILDDPQPRCKSLDYIIF